MIQNIIFDFGKVLVDYDFEGLKNMPFDSEADLQEFTDIVCDPAFVEQCDLELIPFTELIHVVMPNRYPKYTKQFGLFYDRYLSFVTNEVAGMHDYMLDLKRRGYRLYGLSNWSSAVEDVIGAFPIFRLLDGSVMSYQLHITKPDARIYQALLEKYDLKAEECVFADDKAVNVEGAKRVGMKAICFSNQAQFAAELEPMLR